MTRRKTVLMAVLGATILGVAGIAGFAGNNAISADDDDQDLEALIKPLGAAKISLQQGLAASEQEGRPLSGKFEVDDGKFQLSVYTSKDGKLSEVLVDYADGKVTKTEPITKADDLAAADSQGAAMAKATTSLKEAVDKAVTQSASSRAVSAVPSLKDGHPVASIVLLSGDEFKTVQQPLD